MAHLFAGLLLMLLLPSRSMYMVFVVLGFVGVVVDTFMVHEFRRVVGC